MLGDYWPYSHFGRKCGPVKFKSKEYQIAGREFWVQNGRKWEKLVENRDFI